MMALGWTPNGADNILDLACTTNTTALYGDSLTTYTMESNTKLNQDRIAKPQEVPIWLIQDHAFKTKGDVPHTTGHRVPAHAPLQLLPLPSIKPKDPGKRSHMIDLSSSGETPSTLASLAKPGYTNDDHFIWTEGNAE